LPSMSYTSIILGIGADIVIGIGGSCCCSVNWSCTVSCTKGYRAIETALEKKR